MSITQAGQAGGNTFRCAIPALRTPRIYGCCWPFLSTKRLMQIRSLANGSLSKKNKHEFPSTSNWLGYCAFRLIAFAIRTVYPFGRILSEWVVIQPIHRNVCCGDSGTEKNWLSKLSYRQSVKWLLVVVLILPVIVYAHVLVSKNPEELVTFIGGINWQSLLLSIWEAITSVGLCFFLLAAFRKYGNRTSKFWQQTSADSNLTYTLHSVVVVAFTILLEPLGVSPLPKFFIALVLSVICSFAVSFLLRKYRG